MTIDFNLFKDHYQADVQRAISFIGQDLHFFTELKVNHLLTLAKRHLGELKNLTVLDVGCGIGLTDRYLVSNFRSLYGVDIAEGSVEKAKQNNPSINYQTYNGKRLPFSDDTFDLIFTICVIQCVQTKDWKNFVKEMCRVSKKGGLVVIFEHNPLNPLTNHVVKCCEMNKGLPLLSRKQTTLLMQEVGIKIVENPFIIFFPWRGSFFRKMENWTRWIPLGAQYYVAGKK